VISACSNASISSRQVAQFASRSGPPSSPVEFR
jgi:hypothetical protein